MAGGETEQGCRFALHPGGMAVAVERGKKVAGLAGGGVEVGGGFVARDDAESLAGTESRGCDAGRLVVGAAESGIEATHGPPEGLVQEVGDLAPEAGNGQEGC